ncbi:PREDICTED: zinc finger BED domain-containing protein RICESLEEPER 2-like [Erythranthe guttata]|uniref:zinc finger BED domain-containing protein RICESLEEPER 2-like n=1 Tax=Erythranthe guttata TaxID=4155 RepID=UPI00064DDBF0|nr:PREDICTED: zinc finger BED domain-containing protein RICESLEEPER 2-like [Erythranthe guttata]|eukprot:XP_012858997.1 PREDICTED: zinc finger BED domain-containing protein RICESLEEPER 2-like [Erythranthe guttata]
MVEEDTTTTCLNHDTKRKRSVKLRSEVWNHFSKVENKDGTKAKCKCNYCKKAFSCPSKGGTTHLLRHITELKCPIYRKMQTNKNVGRSQTLIHVEDKKQIQDARMVSWQFDQVKSRSDLAELIIVRELPFSFVDDPTFRKFVLNLCPKFKFVSRNTIKSDCLKIYQTEKKRLKDTLQTLSPRICLTTDTWTSKTELPFMALTAHFIDDSWKLHKVILNFVIVPVKASGENLADIITNCLVEWNIEKICTITMDNHSANDIVAEILSEQYSSRDLLLLGGRHLQVRCWCHVLNLIVQEGIGEIKDSIFRVRKAVKYIKASPKRKLEFLQYADQERIPRGKMLVLDLCTRWNSTYLMLESALHFRKAYDRMRSRDMQFKDPPLAEDWEKASVIHKFLETFNIVTKIFSGSEYCTANVFFREVYRILILLRETSNDLSTLLGKMAFNMLLKFEKYWLDKEPNLLLSVALVLDPRYKLKYLEFCYMKIYDNTLATKFTNRVKCELKNLFDEYSITCQVSNPLEGTSKILKEIVPGDNSSKIDMMAEFYKFAEQEDAINKTELELYLEEKLHPGQIVQEDNFNILDWWKLYAAKYPIMARMARDILAIPVSSVASESAFSTGGRVLNKFRSSLLPTTVEALICSQDWIRGGEIQCDYGDEFDDDFSRLKISGKS